MKKILFLICLFSGYHAHSIITDSIMPGPSRKLWIEMNDGKTKGGFIHFSTDSSIVFSSLRYGSRKIIPVEKIQSISYKEGTGFVPRLIIGSAAGFILGFLLGIGACDESDTDEDCGFFRRILGRETTRGAFYQGILFGGLGGFIAGISGRMTYKIPIHNNRNQFKEFRNHTY